MIMTQGFDDVSFFSQCYEVKCLETPGPPGPKGHRGQKVSYRQPHTHKHIHTNSYTLHISVTLLCVFSRGPKETMETLAQRVTVGDRVTPVLKDPSVNPVSK